MNCPICGAQVAEEARFCWKCGAPLTDSSEEINLAVSDLVREFSQRVAERPNDPDARYNLARALIELRRWGPAAKELMSVRDLQPDFPDALYWLAVCYWHLGRLQESRSFLTQLLREDPRHADGIKLLNRLGDRGVCCGASDGGQREEGSAGS